MTSLSQASLPAFRTGLTALLAILDKAEAHAAERQFDTAVLMQMRLAPDMFPFARQVQTVTDMAKNGSSRLAGITPPVYEDTETTWAQLRARVAKTVAYLDALDAAAMDAAAEREIVIPLSRGRQGVMTGRDYLHYFLLPNFYFHLTTAYAILRHCGVGVGKLDFLGAIPLRMV